MYKAMDIANYIVSMSINEGRPVTNLHLQKILYYVQKSFLKQGKELFSDDFEAWQFGPVIPEVYRFFCGFGSMPISILLNTDKRLNLSRPEMELIDDIIRKKGTMDPWDLVEDTHKEGSAWSRSYVPRFNNIISKTLIKEEA